MEHVRDCDSGPKPDNLDHITITNRPDGKYELKCHHCGKKYVPELPCSLDMFLAIMKSFESSHSDCLFSHD